MILRDITKLIIYSSLFGQVLGESYSRVYFQLGADPASVEFSKYGAPIVYQSPQQIAPAVSSLAIPADANFIPPCTAPCFLQSPPVPNANVIYFKAPSTPEDSQPNYEYSYLVYDKSTGDNKAQQEVSSIDGRVRGKYALLQPDGYIREVQYTADDLKGFNAVITKFLPGGRISQVATKPLPCEPSQKPGKEETERKNDTHEKHEEVSADNHEKEKKSEHHKPDKHEEKPRNGKALEHELSIHSDDSHSNGDHKPDEHGVKPNDHEVENENREEKDPHSHSEETANVEEVKPQQSPDHSKISQTQVEDHKLSLIEPTTSKVTETDHFDSYSNIIKCIQTSIKNSESPLAYIIIPSRPCQ